MSFEIPDLDDKTFDELFEEARALIPRYAPQWTDHNFSDPGVTFIDLFAWIAEMQIYYANRITPAIKKKFLKFLGITPVQAAPSTAYVTFYLRNGNESLVIPENTLLIAADGLTGLYEPFETTETVTVTSASIAAIVYKKEKQLFHFSEVLSSTNGYFEPFSTSSRPDGQMLIGLKDKKQENSIRLYFDLVETDLVESTQSTPESDRTPSVNLLWKVWNGSSWNQLSVNDDTCGLNHKGFVTLSGLENAEETRLQEIEGFEKSTMTDMYTWISVSPSGYVGESYEIAPRIHSILTHAVPVRHGRTRTDEYHDGTGFPLQKVSLKHTPVLAGTLSIVINGNEWFEVSDFEASGPDDLHFTIDYGKGELLFGDGERGKIVEKGANNIVIRSYRCGGGLRGNIIEGKIVRIENPEYGNVLIKSSSEASCGREGETLDAALDRARRERKTPSRLITGMDICELAKKTPGTNIFSVTPLFGYHPLFQTITMPTSITLVVIPYTRYIYLSPPIPPSNGFLKRIRQYLDDKKLIASDLHIIGPRYVPVSVTVDVIILPDVKMERMLSVVESAIIDFLNPFIGGADKNGWEVGKPVIASDIVALIHGIEGVVCVKKIKLCGEGCLKIDNKIILPETGLPCSAMHSINVFTDR